MAAEQWDRCCRVVWQEAGHHAQQEAPTGEGQVIQQVLVCVEHHAICKVAEQRLEPLSTGVHIPPEELLGACRQLGTAAGQCLALLGAGMHIPQRQALTLQCLWAESASVAPHAQSSWRPPWSSLRWQVDDQQLLIACRQKVPSHARQLPLTTPVGTPSLTHCITA